MMIIYHLLFVILIVMVVKADYLVAIYRAVLKQGTTTVFILSLLNAVRKIIVIHLRRKLYFYCFFLDFGSFSSSSSSSSGTSYAYLGFIGAGLPMFIIIAALIICVVIILKRKYSTRRLQQVTMATIPQPSVVRYSAYPSSSQHAPQLSTGEETTITSSVPQHAAYGPFYYDAEHAAVGSTANPSVFKTDTSPSDYPDPPPYDECIPDKYTNNQSTLHGGILSAPPPSYASVVSTSATVPVPSATNI